MSGELNMLSTTRSISHRLAALRSSCRNSVNLKSNKPAGINFAVRWHGGPKVEKDAPTVSITFLNPHPASARLKGKQSGEEDDVSLTVEARVGETFLQTAHRHDIDLEGACEGGEI